jgi:NADH dehydrogenase/NADH:ubiquinone oxidoreductase subunit G
MARVRKEIGSNPLITREQQQQERTQAMESPTSQRASKRKHEDSQEEDGLLDNLLDKPTEEESMIARSWKGIGSDPSITQEQQQQERTQALASKRRKPKQKSASALEHSNVPIRTKAPIKAISKKTKIIKK